MIKYEQTTFGFVFGDAEIERLHHDKTGRIDLGLKTSKDELEISVTKTGKIRIFSKKYIEETKECKYTEWKKGGMI